MVLSHSDNLSTSLQRAELCAVDAQENVRLSVTVLQGIRSDRDASLHWTKVTQAAVKLELQAPSLPRRRKMPSRYFEGNLNLSTIKMLRTFTARSTLKLWTLTAL